MMNTMCYWNKDASNILVMGSPNGPDKKIQLQNVLSQIYQWWYLNNPGRTIYLIFQISYFKIGPKLRSLVRLE